MLWQVDEHDVVLGSVGRRRAHVEGILHRSGMVFLVRSDERILIQHRSPGKRIFPDCYDASAAFHVRFGERYEEAASRELAEETGVSAQLSFLGKFIHHDSPEHQVVAVFTCSSDQPIHFDSTESIGAYFLNLNEVESMVRSGKVTPWLREG